jgi:hypothetical protein
MERRRPLQLIRERSMETINSYEGWVGTDAYDVNGDKIGAIDAIYYDDQTGRPE